MSARRLIAALIVFGFAVGSFVSVPSLARYARMQFLEAEPKLAAPIDAPGGVAWLRNDRNGKGHFGASRDGGRKHRGIDFLSPLGSPVYAAKSGRVLEAGWQRGYGGYVKISHPDGGLTVYAHLSRLTVRRGDWVARSSVVGLIGKSGNASQKNTLPHIHFEYRRNGGPIDPTPNLAVPVAKPS